MLKKILLIHAIVEMLVGLLLLWDPGVLGFLDELHDNTKHMGKIYGIIAFIFGVISYQLWKHYTESDMYRKIIIAIMAFHLMIGFYLFGLYRQDVLGPILAPLYHLIIAGAFAFFYMNEAVGKRDKK